MARSLVLYGFRAGRKLFICSTEEKLMEPEVKHMELEPQVLELQICAMAYGGTKLTCRDIRMNLELKPKRT
jgi:hypothetical protein